MTTSYVDIVFDGPPSHESGRFIEVENDKGASINFGEWVHRPDGFWALRIGAPISGEPPGRKKTSLDEDFGEYVLRNLMLACSHWSSSRNVDGTMNIAESELAAAFEARAREGIKELAAPISGERVREACAKVCEQRLADRERFLGIGGEYWDGYKSMAEEIAAAIRALDISHG